MKLWRLLPCVSCVLFLMPGRAHADMIVNWTTFAPSESGTLSSVGDSVSLDFFSIAEESATITAPNTIAASASAQIDGGNVEAAITLGIVDTLNSSLPAGTPISVAITLSLSGYIAGRTSSTLAGCGKTAD